jgi:glycosyltransferase involved in cell wall biosynthesis
MRILLVIFGVAPRYGGLSVMGPELSRELVRQGHEVSIYTTDVDGPGHLDVPVDRPVISEGVKIHHFRGWRLPGNFVVSLGLWRALRDTVTHYDIVHSWSVYGFATTAAAYWCRERDVPHMVFPHGSLDPFLLRRNRPRKWLYAKLFAERDYRRASAVLFNTEEEMRLASKWSGLKEPEGHTGRGPRRFVVPVGIDPSWLQEPDAAAGERLRSKFPQFKGRRLVVCLGRINFKKGLDILARAFARIAHGRDDLHLVVAGPDNEGYGKKVRRWLAGGGVLEKATFTGPLQGEERLAVMQEAEVFALPSYTENFGGVVTEAMASGVPVVISDQVNIWPDVSRAGAGLVVPCDVEATAQALRSILSDPEKGRRMGDSGRRWVAEHLPWKVVAAQMARAYGEIVLERRTHQACIGENLVETAKTSQ